MPTGAFNICCPRDCVSRHKGGMRVPPLNPSESIVLSEHYRLSQALSQAHSRHGIFSWTTHKSGENCRAAHTKRYLYICTYIYIYIIFIYIYEMRGRNISSVYFIIYIYIHKLYTYVRIYIYIFSKSKYFQCILHNICTHIYIFMFFLLFKRKCRLFFIIFFFIILLSSLYYIMYIHTFIYLC